MYALDVVECAVASCSTLTSLLLLLLLIGVHSLLVVVDCAHAIDVVNCARTTLLLLLITHTPHSLLLLIVCTHTRTSCYCWFCTQKLIDWVCALFVVDCETLLMIVFPKKKEQNLLLCMWSRFYSYCTYPDSLASYYIYICVCVCIATYLVLVIGACRTLTFKVLLDNHESMQNNELYDEWKSCLVWNVLSIIVSMNNSLARGDKIPEFY